MATMAADQVFLDTNVLVYANIAAAPLLATALQAILSREQAGVALWIKEEKVQSDPPKPPKPPKPRSLGIGESGVTDTARRAGEERPVPRPWH